jgi:CheY-like chemotaxis protein
LSEGDYDPWQEKRRNSRNPHPTPMIVLGSISASSVVRQSASKNAIFINQPFGPRKMARALAAAMQSRSQSDPNSENQTLGAIASSPSALHILTKPSPVTSNSDPPPTYTESRPSSGIDASSLPSTPTSPKNNQSSRNSDANNGHESNLRKVLLVEDNSINMKLLVATMRKLKRPYTSASNGLEAVSAYSSEPASFALILMDISMPVMDGYTATELIRSLEEKNKWGRCTIIALTGVGDAEAKRRAFLAGVDDFMTKPVSMAKLGGIINNLEGGGNDNGNANKNNENENKNNNNENENRNRRQDEFHEKGRQNGQHNPRQHAVQQPA